MNLVILGASGATGQKTVAQALKAGHSVTAVVRTPSKITIQDPNLKVVEGDIMTTSSLSAIFPGHDAIVSCLGFPRNPRPVTGYIESMKAIDEAMRAAQVKRIIIMTAWWSKVDSASRANWIVRWMVVPFLRPVLEGMYDMEEWMKENSQDLEYTVVRPPGLTNGPLTNSVMSVSEDYQVDTASMSTSTSRADVAAFMLSILSTTKYFNKMISITVAPKKN